MPWMRTVSPDFTRAAVTTAFQAVTPAQGRVAASSKLRWLGELYDAILVEHDLLRERAVDVAAEGAFELFRGGIAVQPVLEKGAGDAIADRDLRYSFANSGDDSGAVRTGDAVGLELRIVEAFDHHQVAVVERDSVDVDDDLAGTGLGCGNFVERELVDAECGNAPGLHGFIRTGNSGLELHIPCFVQDDESRGDCALGRFDRRRAYSVSF